jgi:hypothetical protein
MIHDKFVIMEGQIQDVDGENEDEEDGEEMEVDDADENSPDTDGSNTTPAHSEAEEENKTDEMSDLSEEEESEDFSISVKPEVRSLLSPLHSQSLTTESSQRSSRGTKSQTRYSLASSDPKASSGLLHVLACMVNGVKRVPC